jgi:hypothetical protein
MEVHDITRLPVKPPKMVGAAGCLDGWIALERRYDTFVKWAVLHRSPGSAGSAAFQGHMYRNSMRVSPQAES